MSVGLDLTYKILGLVLHDLFIEHLFAVNIWVHIGKVVAAASAVVVVVAVAGIH
jgi:hypothetical protein